MKVDVIVSLYFNTGKHVLTEESLEAEKDRSVLWHKM